MRTMAKGRAETPVISSPGNPRRFLHWPESKKAHHKSHRTCLWSPVIRATPSTEHFQVSLLGSGDNQAGEGRHSHPCGKDDKWMKGMCVYSQ